MKPAKSITELLNMIIKLKDSCDDVRHYPAPPDATDVLDYNTGETQAVKDADKLQTVLKEAVATFAIHPELKDFCLAEADVLVLAYMYKQICQDYSIEFVAKDLVQAVGNKDWNFMEQVDYFTSLLDRNILIVSHIYRSRNNQKINVILNGSFSMCFYLLNSLMGRSCRQELMTQLEDKPRTEKSPLGFVKAYFDMLNEYCPELNGETLDEEPNLMGYVLSNNLDLLWDKIDKLPREHELVAAINEFKLSRLDTTIALLIYYYGHINHTHVYEYKLANMLSSNMDEFREMLNYMRNESVLSTMGYVKKGKLGYDNNSNLLLQGSLLARLVSCGKIAVKDASIHELIGDGTKQLKVITPAQTIDQLILHDDELCIINTIIKRLKQPEQYDLAKWGLLTPSLSNDTGALNSCIVLLYGYPGTGKTHTAGVFANELGRPLVEIEAKCIRGCYFGETEKNVSRLFADMRDIVASVNPAPVFLLNEADQLLHMRTGILDNSCATTENAIQNIILEELETFPGILIMTTNLTQNLDEAMSRRFHFKLELKVPDVECAKKLWRLHLPHTIPGAAEIDCDALARKYCFTGGIIRIVVQNACFEAMIRDENRILMQDDVERYAQLEMCSYNMVIQRKIGF